MLKIPFQGRSIKCMYVNLLALSSQSSRLFLCYLFLLRSTAVRLLPSFFSALTVLVAVAFSQEKLIPREARAEGPSVARLINLSGRAGPSGAKLREFERKIYLYIYIC